MANNREAATFLAQLRSAHGRVSELQHHLARRASLLRDSMTRLRLGVPVEIVSADIIRSVTHELTELGISEEDILWEGSPQPFRRWRNAFVNYVEGQTNASRFAALEREADVKAGDPARA